MGDRYARRVIKIEQILPLDDGDDINNSGLWEDEEWERFGDSRVMEIIEDPIEVGAEVLDNFEVGFWNGN